MRKIAFCLVFFALFVSASLFADGLDQSLLERLKSEGCPILRARGSLPEKLHLKWIRSRKDASLEMDFYSDGKYYILKTRELPREGDTSVHSECYVKNNSYYFCVGRNDDKPWKMLGSGRLDHPDAKGLLGYLLEVEVTGENSPYMLGTRSLADYIEDPDFKITKIESVFDEGTETVRFEFENHPKSLFGNTDNIKGGTVSFLPSRDWEISEMTIDFDWDGGHMRNERTFQYGDKPDPFFPARELRIREIRLPDDQSKGYSITHNNTILECDGAECPREEFFPEFYGLRKPVLPLPPGYYLRRVLMALGLILIFAALRSKWRKRRARKVGAEQPEPSAQPEES